MTEAETPAARPHPVSGRVLLLLSLVFLAAVATRFWHLGDRPLHHDESIHAYQSWSLSRGGDWRYDPAYHGPFLYYVNALVYKIAGASNFTARLMPAVFGLILIGFAWPLRRWIGKTAAAAYAIFILTSGHMTYFSRFIREDLYSLVFTLATILAFQRFLETDRAKWLSLAAASFALAGVTKENAYMTGVLFVAYGLWCLVAAIADSRRLGTPLGDPLRRTLRWVGPRLLPLSSAAILFLIIWVTMYTGFGKHPGDWLAIPRAVSYWMGQHTIARIPGPWYYYFPQLAYYETAVLVAALFAFSSRQWRMDPLLRALLVIAPLLLGYAVVRSRVPALGGHPLAAICVLTLLGVALALFVIRPMPEPTLSPFFRFLAFWAAGSLAIYGWAREKVPWLTVHPLLPIAILASIGVARLWAARRETGPRVALAAIGLLLCVNTGGMYLASFRYGAQDIAREPHHAEMLAYVQTSEDLVRALGVLPAATARIPAGQPVITVAGEAGWPLTWYLRDVVTSWASRIESASTPIVVADWDPQGMLEKQLAEKYDAKRVPIRAWWFPEVHREGPVVRPTLKDFLRWWVFHEIWSPIGSQDATFFVRKDLAGSGPLAPIAVPIQDTSSRDYPGEAVTLPPGRAWGEDSGANALVEPRGLATDPLGNTYVADTKNSRIVVISGTGAFLRSLGSKGTADGQLNEACGVAVGPDGVVYVADTWNHRVARFGPGGEPRPSWIDPEKTFFGPRAVVFSGGSLYVSDTGNKRIVRFDADGKVVRAWGSAGNRPSQFVEPVGIAADGAGRIYVADTGNHRIQVFEADGKFLREFPVFGWKDFYTEPYLVVGPSESVIVTDSWKGVLAQYDATGNLLHSFKAEGLKRPTGIALDSFGRVTVSDRDTNRLFSWPLDALR